MISLEYTLFVRSRKNLLLLVTCLICFLASSFFIRYRYQIAKDKVLDQHQQTIDRFDHYLLDLDQLLETGELSEESYQAEVAFVQEYQTFYHTEMRAVQEEDWDYFYEKNIDGLSSLMTHEKGGAMHDGYTMAPETLENTLLVSTYLKEHRLPSAFPLTYFLTAFEDSRSPLDEEILQSLGNQALKGSSHEIWRWQKGNSLWVMVPLFLLLFANFFIKDNTSTHRQLRLLQTAGLSKKQITRNKYIAFAGLFSLSFLTIYGLQLLIATLINGNSSWIYPVTYYTTSLQTAMVTSASITLELRPIYQMIAAAALVQFSYVLWVSGLAQLFSRLFHNSLAGSLTAIGLAIGGSFFPHLWNPFSYFRAGDLADGTLLVETNQTGYQPYQAFLCLAGACLVIYILHYFLLCHSRKEA